MLYRYRHLLICSITLLLGYAFLAGFAWAMAPVTPDPFDDAAGLWALLRNTWRTGGAWPAIILGLYAFLAAVRLRAAWLRKGKVAAWSAGALGILGAVADLWLGAGTWSGVIVAVASMLLLVVDARKPGP